MEPVQGRCSITGARDPLLLRSYQGGYPPGQSTAHPTSRPADLIGPPAPVIVARSLLWGYYEVDAVDRVDTVDTVDTADTADAVHAVHTVDRVDRVDAVDTTDAVDTVDTIDTVNDSDTIDTADAVIDSMP